MSTSTAHPPEKERFLVVIEGCNPDKDLCKWLRFRKLKAGDDVAILGIVSELPRRITFDQMQKGLAEALGFFIQDCQESLQVSTTYEMVVEKSLETAILKKVRSWKPTVTVVDKPLQKVGQAALDMDRNLLTNKIRCFGRRSEPITATPSGSPSAADEDNWVDKFHGLSPRAGTAPTANPPLGSDIDLSLERFIVPRLTHDEILKMTKNHAPANKLGEGSFGTVYRGEMGTRGVAVKELKPDKTGVDVGFRRELRVLSKINHIHVVRLEAFCLQPMCLVYSLCEQGSLADHLFGKKTALGWAQRWSIAKDVADGLLYLHDKLHTGPVIHRDICAANILLTSDYSAQIADFGLAKVMTNDDSAISGPGVRGKEGYCDPEYQLTMNPTKKTDVFAYGVMLLEMIVGAPAFDPNRPNAIGGQRMATYLWMWKEMELRRASEGDDEALKSLVDDRLPPKDYDREQMLTMIKIVQYCLRRKGDDRPDFQQILNVLYKGQPDFSTLRAYGDSAQHV